MTVASNGAPARTRLELWGGVECTVNRVHDLYHDQTSLTGHDGRAGDLSRIASLGIRRLRYPVLWERVAPEGLESADWTWTDARLAALRSLGIAPIAGLVHHGSGPRHTSLVDPEFAPQLAAYAAAVAGRYPWIDAYTPVNEPLTTARFSGLYGHWYPHHAGDAPFVRALLNQCRGTVLAMRAIREVNPAARLVQTDDAGKTYSRPSLAYQAEFENHRRWLAWDLIAGAVGRTHPLWTYLLRSGASAQELAWFLDSPCPPDVVGLNYYLTSDRFLDDRVERYPAASVGGNGRRAYADIEAVRACRAISGHHAIALEAWQRYGRPVAFTEVHLGCTREEQMRWLLEAWDAAHSARRCGADVRAVTAWALFGLSDWDSLVTQLRRHYEPGVFDVRAPEPRATALARVVTALCEGGEPAQPVLATAGWWRRDTRLWQVAGATYPRGFPPEPARLRQAPRLGPPRPIAIIGAGGTLGGAFARICGWRGLLHQAFRRSDLDICDAAAIARTLDAVQPWAVINAAGYVRVDEAEGQPEECRRLNTEGPALLAGACAARGIRLVTFSSDLVFDGTAARPYVESDLVSPLNVYGRTKADSEAAVARACADALVIRSSAFFGPWDQWNIVHGALAALAGGSRWQAPCGQRVSPTYVPDLVHATLDLLIDGAAGIWHLASAGDVSWAELGRRVAVLAGYPEESIEEHDPALTPAAPRPAYSVLGSERGQLLRPLDDALARFLADRTAAAAQEPRRGAVVSPFSLLPSALAG